MCTSLPNSFSIKMKFAMLVAIVRAVKYLPSLKNVKW
jgi:hypothetical protein